MLKIIQLIFFLIINIVVIFGYKIPNATIEVLYPKGFQVWIPADEGVTLFAFHGKLNEQMVNLDAGRWSTDIIRARNHRFTFINTETKLKIGDILYFWTFAIHDRKGYRQDNGIYYVTGYQMPLHLNDSEMIEYEQTIDKNVLPKNNIDKAKCENTLTVLKDNQCPAHRGELIFEDNFDVLNLTIWRQERRFSGPPDNEFNVYLTIKDNLYVEDGILNIKPTRLESIYGEQFYLEHLNLGMVGIDCTGRINSSDCSRTGQRRIILPPLISAQMTTINTFHFVYGRIEIKAKLPSEQWIFPQLMLKPIQTDYGTENLAYGQMRVAFINETTHNNNNNLYGGVLLNSVEPYRSSNLCSYKELNGKLWSDDYHIYGLEWTKSEIIMSVDAVEYCRIQINVATKSNSKVTTDETLLQEENEIGPFDKPFYLVIGVAVGGYNDFTDDEQVTSTNKPWKNNESFAMWKFWKRMKLVENWPSVEYSTLKIDYIKVFAL